MYSKKINFLARNQDKLEYNPLMALIYKNMLRQNPERLIRIVVSDEIIPGNLTTWAKPISPPCKGAGGIMKRLTWNYKPYNAASVEFPKYSCGKLLF